MPSSYDTAVPRKIIDGAQEIRFDDGAAYEQMMGIWSRIAGNVFLDWLAPGSERSMVYRDE